MNPNIQPSPFRLIADTVMATKMILNKYLCNIEECTYNGIVPLLHKIPEVLLRIIIYKIADFTSSIFIGN